MPQPTTHTATDRTLDRHDRDWVCEAVARIAADFSRSSGTHLIKLELPCLGDIDLYLKDESTHPSGSLKHRLARSLMLYGLCNGWIRKDTPIIESSSGSTAISEAYFARRLGLPFSAVLPDTTAKEKIAEIEFYSGECHRVAANRIYDEARRLAGRLNGHYVDQFTFAERATDRRRDPHRQRRVADRGDRPAAGGTLVSAGRHRSDDAHFGHREHRRDLMAGNRSRQEMRRVDGNQSVRRVADRRRDDP